MGGEVDLGDHVPGVRKHVRLPDLVIDERTRALCLLVDERVGHADVRVEVRRDRIPQRVDPGDHRPLRGVMPVLRRARQVVRVGLDLRAWYVFATELRGQASLLRPERVPPGTELPRRNRLRLAPDRGGEAAHDVKRSRAGEHPVVEVVGVGLYRPGVRAVRAQAKQAQLRVIEQEPVAAARDQPRHRKYDPSSRAENVQGSMNREAIGRSGGIHAPSSDHVSTVPPA